MLNIDLTLLENGKRFQDFCFRLAKCDFPDSVPLAVGSWDGGRDIVQFNTSDEGDVIWQTKFTTRNLDGSLKDKIKKSLDGLDKTRRVLKWILCLSIDATGNFHNWLRQIMAGYPFIIKYEVWDRQQLLIRLEKHPDILQTFFYRSYKELEKYFRVEDLELIKFALDPSIEWRTPDPKVLYFSKKGDTESDLVFDITVRNRGTIEALLQTVEVELTDIQRALRGVPGEALLYPQITYVVSLKNGEEGKQSVSLEPPLTVKSGSHERLKIRCTDVGFAWSGALRLTLIYGANKRLSLPWVRIYS